MTTYLFWGKEAPQSGSCPSFADGFLSLLLNLFLPSPFLSPQSVFPPAPNSFLTRRCRAGLEQAYTSGNAASYHKLEESIRCVKEGSTASAHQPYSAQKQPRDARASPSLHARANQQHTLPSISNGLSNGHGYAPGPNPLQPAYGGSYGNMNGGMASHRPYQAVPQSMFYDSTGFVPAPPLAVPSLRPYQPAQGPTFHPSPFYQVIQTVGSPHLCHGKESPLPPSSRGFFHWHELTCIKRCRNTGTPSRYR